MKFFKKLKDGGKESHVWGYFFVKIKNLFSVVLLRFDHGTREAYHNHAFDCVSWVVKGKLVERLLTGEVNMYGPSLKPVVTRKNTFHQVCSKGTTWVLSFRGPWAKTWKEYLPREQRFVTLTHGRKELT